MTLTLARPLVYEYGVVKYIVLIGVKGEWKSRGGDGKGQGKLFVCQD